MKHFYAIIIKFLACLVLLSVVLGLFFGMAFGAVFLISLALGITSYIIGDLLILPKTSNIIATIVDFAMALGIIWLLSYSLYFADNLFFMSLIAAAGTAVFEYFFHKYVKNNVINDNEQRAGYRTGQLQYQTEASEELTPPRVDLTKKDE